MNMKTNTTLQVVALSLAAVVTALSFAAIGVYSEQGVATQTTVAKDEVETIVVTASRLA
jgi:hypothetical protein